MLDKVIHFSVNNKFIIGLFTIALIIIGGYSVATLPIDALPDITNNQVQIVTTSPTLATQDVEQFITYPVEQAIKPIPKIVELRSVSRFGLSVVTVVFEESADLYWARAQISERLKEAENVIPKSLGTPEMAPVSTGLGEIFQYVVFPEKGYEKKYDATQLRTIQDWIIKPQLIGTPGVAEVNTLGGLMKQYEIAVSPDRLRAMDVSITEIFAALEANNENTGGAYIDKKPYAYFIRSIGMVSNTYDIGKIVIKNRGGIPVLVRDVARVQTGSSVRYGATTKDGKGEEVSGMVMMLKGENSGEVTARVKDKIEQIKKSLPQGVAIAPFLDRTKLVGQAISTVEKNLIEGALIVIFILVLLLGNWRAGLVVASVIPLALLFAISLMKLFGVSGNLMSLGAIDFGIIVDGAVIIVEAIIHRLEAMRKGRLDQKQMNDEVFGAASKIRGSAAFGEIIILIVYLPILALTGTEGKMFGPMALTVSFAILGAFILSLTYIPMMCSLVLSKSTGHSPNISDKIISAAYGFYRPLLHKALSAKKVVLIASGILFISALLIFSNMGGEFIPTLDEGDIATHLIISPGSSLSQEIDATTRAEQLLRSRFPEIKMIVSKIGSAEIPTDPMPMEAADMILILKDKSEWTSASTKEELISKMEEALDEIPGATTEFSQPVQMRMNELMTGVRSDVAIKIFGEDTDRLVSAGDEVSGMIKDIEGVSDIRAEKVDGLPQIVVKYNKDKLALYGLNIGDVNKVIRMGFAGEIAGRVYEGERRFDMVVRVDSDKRQDISNLRSLYITLPSGNQIPLDVVADVKFEDGPMQISREEGRRRITVGFNVRGRDVQSVVADIQNKLDRNLKLPPGYYITYGGQFENLQQANSRLMVAVPVALALIFILLYFTFRSVKQAVLIFTAIPLSAIGGVLALWLRGMPFSISAGVGFIALFGVAVLNGIVLIACFNQLKQEGMMDIIQRITEGAKTRLRPVMLTALVASLGFLPMALSNGAGAEVQKPLATVVIGGLITATLLTLIVLPVLYYYFEKGFGRMRAGTAFTVVLCMLPFVSVAQQPLTLDQAVLTGTKNNSAVRAAALGFSRRQQLLATAIDVPKAQVNATFGQINSAEQDKNLSFSQSFNPFQIAARRRVLSENAKVGELQLQQTRQEVTYAIRQSWNTMLYYTERNKVLEEQNKLLAQFVRAAELKFRTGETGSLESSTANARQQELQQQIKKNNAMIVSEKLRLRTLLKLDADFSVAESEVFSPMVFEAAADSTALTRNNALQLAGQQVNVAKAEHVAEKSSFYPELTAGYFIQSLTGSQDINGAGRYYDNSLRFQGFSVGVSVPLFWAATNARIRAARANAEIQQANADYLKAELQSTLSAQREQLETYRAMLVYYTETALPNAAVISGNATKAYQNGDISYVEFVQSMETALSIKNNYTDAINNYNQAIITIQYLLNL